MCRHVPAAGRCQKNIREGFRMEERRDGAVKMSPVAVPFQLIILRSSDGHLFCSMQKTEERKISEVSSGFNFSDSVSLVKIDACCTLHALFENVFEKGDPALDFSLRKNSR